MSARRSTIASLVSFSGALQIACATDRKDVGSHEGGASGAEEGSGSEGSGTGTGASGGSGTDSGSSGSSGTSSTSGGSGTSTSGTSESSSDSGGIRLDVSAETEGGPMEGGSTCMGGDQECGCTAVDLLFVIDSSVSMGDYQDGLATVTPAFTDAIFSSLPPGTDLHVGVTTTSMYVGSGASPGEGNCMTLGTDAEFLGYYVTPDTSNTGENGGQGRLRTYQGMSYFATTTDGDPAPLKAWLGGNIGEVGEYGSVYEMPASGAAWSFHAANDAANAGFVRDEGAVLVIFILTDEVGNDPEDVQKYHDMVVAKKPLCGGDRCVVTAGIMQPCMATTPGNKVYDFLSSFGKPPAIGDIGPELEDCFEDCADGDITECTLVNPPVTCPELMAGEATAHYAETLGTALAEVIAKTCEEIPPPVG